MSVIISEKRKPTISKVKLENQLKRLLREEIRAISEQPRPLPRPLLTEQETANLLGVSVKTLPIWRHRGQGPDYIKVESSVRYKLSDLHNYIKKQRISQKN